MKLPKLDLRIPIPAKWYDKVYDFLTGAQLEALKPKNKRPLTIFLVEAIIVTALIGYALYTWAVELGWARRVGNFLAVHCLEIGTCEFKDLYGGFSLLVIVLALCITLFGMQVITIVRSVIASRKAKKEIPDVHPTD